MADAEADAHQPCKSAEEPTLQERPLEFLYEYAPSATSIMWRPLLWDEERRSFAFYRSAALQPEVGQEFFQQLQRCAPWQTLSNKAKTRVSRYTEWYTRDRACRCEYTYGMDTRVNSHTDDGGIAAAHAEVAFREVMENLIEHVFAHVYPSLPTDAYPDCANLNWYDDGTQGVGWHSDDELLFMGALSDCPIVSLSLGGTREFWLAARDSGTPDVRKGVVEVDLHHGDIITMEGLTQKHYSHVVPIAGQWDVSRQQPRINVTFRWLRVHKLQCPLSLVARQKIQLESEQANELDVGNSDCKPVKDASDTKALPTVGVVSTDQDSDPVSKCKSRFFKIVDASTEKPIERPEVLAASKLRWLADATADGSIVPSAMPASVQGLLGQKEITCASESCRPCSRDFLMQLWPSDASEFKQSSANVRWQACDSCGHSCWGGGRACREGQGSWSGYWFCRCCWQTWMVASN
eukprot:TRINITY_DN9309_c0_g2_i1.p1 TRINITY_DN9309_c0_g2~~TRINITY_DN9309_c0_g2_i1.p1  ORF type:complete len:464 (+),score=23.72 TRINITY_DN9309_c0_g2_i1:56-1447(+)